MPPDPSNRDSLPDQVWSRDLSLLNAAVSRLQAKNERLREALRTYGQHKPGCRREQWLPCGCGLETALATDEQEAHRG